jgi:hypothetical protein
MKTVVSTSVIFFYKYNTSMIIDYNKLNFTQEEKEYLSKESKIAILKNPNHIPIIILIKSNILKIEKHKFLVPESMTIQEFLNSLDKKLINKQNSDSIIYNITHFEKNSDKIIKSDKSKYLPIKNTFKLLKQLYSESKDPEINMLIITISRHTIYKYIKNIFLGKS